MHKHKPFTYIIFNIFFSDLNKPLEPTLSLAGEVEGLTPTAVNDKPADPRLFVISRSADAMEVLSEADFNERVILCKLCADCEDICGPQSEVGGVGGGAGGLSIQSHQSNNNAFKHKSTTAVTAQPQSHMSVSVPPH